jgi:hypothetical protein
MAVAGPAKSLCTRAQVLVKCRWVDGAHLGLKGACNVATTLEKLEQRLAAVEEELRQLRLQFNASATGTTAKSWAELRAQSRREKPLLRALIARAYEKMGITGTPVPPQQLREMMAADGIREEDNLFSRGIQEMREE